MTAASVDVDPRFAARRVEVRRAEGRRRLRVLIGVAVLLVAGFGAWAATRSALLDVDHIRVSGNATHIEVEEVLAAEGIIRGAPMLDLDLDAAHAALAASPWVESVAVDRAWPGSVEVTVVERRAVAAVQEAGGGVQLVSVDGHRLAARREVPSDLPVVAVDLPADQPPGPAVTEVLRAAAAMPADLVAWTEILTSGDEGVEVRLVGGARAVLGSGVDFSDELRALAAVLTSVRLACLEEIDVSVQQNPVLRRVEPCEPPSESEAVD